MARFVYPTKGSPEAFAWAAKMQAARARKKKQIRALGQHRELQFFGPGRDLGPKPKNHSKNPKGSTWEPPHPWNVVAESAQDGTKFILASDGNVYARSSFGWVNHNTLQEFTDHALKHWRPLRWKKNPGEHWHKGMAKAAGDYSARSTGTVEKAMFKGMEAAHKDSAGAARRLGMNPGPFYKGGGTTRRARQIPRERQRHRKNPLAVFSLGNPPKRVNAAIAGVVYSRCLEIRAEKTKFKPGLYKHPFAKSSGVQILALDNGDLLVHSTRGVNLWEPA